jgi:hypothetical protein
MKPCRNPTCTHQVEDDAICYGDHRLQRSKQYRSHFFESQSNISTKELT